MLNLTYLNLEADGRLGIYLTDVGKAERDELYKNLLYRALANNRPYAGETMLDMGAWLEQCSYGSGYSEFSLVTPEQVGGLTSCDLILARDVTFDEDMQTVLTCRGVWWYSSYMLRDALYPLLADGVVYLDPGCDETASH